MKNATLFSVAFVLTCVVMSCGNSSEKKAQELIKEDLKLSLDDWSSYESVSFGSLDSTFTLFLEDKSYIESMERFDMYTKKSSDIKTKTLFAKNDTEKLDLLELAKVTLDSALMQKQAMDSIRENFIPQFNGWSMEHIFRANNALGAKQLLKIEFYFDKDITKVTDSFDFSEE